MLVRCHAILHSGAFVIPLLAFAPCSCCRSSKLPIQALIIHTARACNQDTFSIHGLYCNSYSLSQYGRPHIASPAKVSQTGPVAPSFRSLQPCVLHSPSGVMACFRKLLIWTRTPVSSCGQSIMAVCARTPFFPPQLPVGARGGRSH